MFGDTFLNFLDRYFAIISSEDVMQDIVGRLERNWSPDEMGIGYNAIECAL